MTGRVLLLLLSVFLLSACSNQNNVPSRSTEETSQSTIQQSSPGTSPSNVNSSINYRVESFVSNLDVPLSIVFTSPDRILVTDRDGRVRLIEKGVVSPTPMISFTVSSRSEEG